MKTMRNCLLAAALTCAGLAQAQDIKVAYNGDISGSPSAESGQIAVMGISAAIDDLNQRGGVLGRKLAFLVRDDLGQPPKSIQNMTDLIDREKVAVVFGPTNSGNALAWKHIANQKKMPVLVSSASSTAITEPAGSSPNYLFRVSMVDRDQAAALVAYAAKSPDIKNIGFFVETTGYGQAGLKDMEQIAALHGIKPAVIEKFDARDTDMTSQLAKAKAAGVDTLVVWAQAAPLGHLVRSMEKMDYMPRVLTTWAASFSGFPQVAGNKLMEWPVFLTTSSEAKSAAAQSLQDRIGPKLANPSMFWAASQAYDTVLLWAAAAEQAQSLDGAAVRAAMEDLQQPVDGLVKQYSKPFSKTVHEGLQAQDYHWSRWQNGKVVDFKDPVLDAMTPADFKK
ncbi:putative branched-chain amino acid-binding protein [Bordetella trematum]|uniref:ABC transporter substrate-binding protein n=1 Tax=Bordetella trematum TaxID=123899 RepID=UPI00079721FE|nr:ABC transporter substrate-binding protein [Bordetella trematum]SAI23669.1 putative branched-chain amino acid-binding protein [Bordetella trematum]SPU50304.1 putative branched-chain amino acid-binding protein [Bordetella trematum]VDH08047.1 Leucine-, isoleucine-, valine-, threonine-, and alanine-binding protein precursor [Bordetella trematum]